MKLPCNATLLLLVSSLVVSGLFSGPAWAGENKQIYLVRHAEKQLEAGNDPHLTELGNRRAEKLAQILKSKKITAIYSTDYHRTRETAKPLAELLAIQLMIYNPAELAKFAEMLKQSSETILVVGHSNTTPQLAELLGGDSFGEIDESVYDRLYQLTFAKSEVKTLLLNFE